MATKATTKDSLNTLTMEELLATQDFKPKSVRRGEVVEGTVVSVNSSEVLVDIGGKSEGIISGRELGDEKIELKSGDKILAYVMQSEDETGQTVLSVKRAGGEKRWRELQTEFNSGTPVEVRGIETNRGGLVVELGGVRGFIPSSQLDSSHSGMRGIGKAFTAKVIELDRKGNRLILSQRVLTQETSRKKFEDAAARYKAGQELSGKVAGVMPYGLFVTLEEGLEGLVHISEISWERVNSLTELYKIGDEVKVKVLSVDPTAGRINLSIRVLTEDPWKDKVAKLEPGTKTQGEVIKLTQYGVVVQLSEGIEGMIPSSKVPEYLVDLKPGTKLDLLIDKLNPESRRVSLTIDEGDINELKPIEELVSDPFKAVVVSEEAPKVKISKVKKVKKAK